MKLVGLLGFFALAIGVILAVHTYRMRAFPTNASEILDPKMTPMCWANGKKWLARADDMCYPADEPKE